jgi:uncharacterized protein YndB with AHSA1/START domain
MAAYSFVTTWFIPADSGRVWEALNTPERYPEWWPSFVAYRPLTPGVTGVGARAERVVRGALPYRLRYTTTTTRFDPPREVAYDADGDLIGSGRFLLAPRDGGTEVTFLWDVRTARRVMNWSAPLLRPLFAWNHNRVMAQGERGLRRLLAGTGPGPSGR